MRGARVRGASAGLRRASEHRQLAHAYCHQQGAPPDTPEPDKTRKARGKAADLEAYQGISSFLQWVRENAGRALLGARDSGHGWQDCTGWRAPMT